MTEHKIRYRWLTAVILCWLLPMPVESDETQVTLKETYLIPMRDGITLATDVLRPNDQKTHPVFLHRTPYNKNTQLLPETIVSLLLLKGYALVFQDTRGRYASQGADSVFLTDGWGALQDGYDTIDWLTHQSWCNGKVGLFGASASGITTYRAVASLHPAIRCAVAIVAPSDFYSQVVYPGGEYGKALCEGWISEQGSTYMIAYYLRFPYYQALWEQMNLHTRTDSMRVPILHIGGWYDCFSEGPIAAFNDLQRHRSIPQKLVMGPWVHSSVGSATQVGQLSYPNANFDVAIYSLQWFDHWLLNSDNGVQNQPAVQYYLLGDPVHPEEGGCRWLQSDAWPPAEAQSARFYLAAGGGLIEHRPVMECTAQYRYDPADAPLTLGGNNLNLQNGPYDQRPVISRPDVLSFVTTPLAAPVRLEGYATAMIYLSSDQADTDVCLKLIDVYPDGREMLVVDGIRRARFREGYTEILQQWLQPDLVAAIPIDLPPTAILFSKGHRIKITVASANYPRFELNPNTAKAANDRSTPLIANQTIHLGGSHASYVDLPLLRTGNRVDQPMQQPVQAHLSVAFPNPFNSATHLSYQLNLASEVTIEVYTVMGSRIARLYQGRQSSGEHLITWNGVDQNGIAMPSGLYLIRMMSERTSQVRKVMLVR